MRYRIIQLYGRFIPQQRMFFWWINVFNLPSSFSTFKESEEQLMSAIKEKRAPCGVVKEYDL